MVKHGPLAAQKRGCRRAAVHGRQGDLRERPRGVDQVTLAGVAGGAPAGGPVVHPERDRERHEEQRGEREQLATAAAHGVRRRGIHDGSDSWPAAHAAQVEGDEQTAVTRANANHWIAYPRCRSGGPRHRATVRAIGAQKPSCLAGVEQDDAGLDVPRRARIRTSASVGNSSTRGQPGGIRRAAGPTRRPGDRQHVEGCLSLRVPCAIDRNVGQRLAAWPQRGTPAHGPPAPTRARLPLRAGVTRGTRGGRSRRHVVEVGICRGAIVRMPRRRTALASGLQAVERRPPASTALPATAVEMASASACFSRARPSCHQPSETNTARPDAGDGRAPAGGRGRDRAVADAEAHCNLRTHASAPCRHVQVPSSSDLAAHRRASSGTGLVSTAGQDEGQSKRMVNALTVRIVLSVLLFVLLFVPGRAA